VDTVGTGSAKLILFGEHAAVHGFPAIGTPLPEETTVRLHGPGRQAWNLEGVPAPDRGVIESLMTAMEELLPEVERRCISISSAVPRGVGFGSSAALCTALSSAALGTRSGDVWKLAHQLERVFHGTPSGVDTGLSFLPGVTAFEPRPPALPAWERAPCAPLWLVVGAVPRMDNSAALIRGIGERMRSGESSVREALAGLGRIAVEARRRLGEQTAATVIARLADEAQAVLADLGLSSPSLDALLAEGRSSGALGGKLSGAGGGGAFFLVCDSQRAAQNVAARLGRAGETAPLAAAPRALCIGEPAK